MMESDHLNNEELKLEILRIVKENGTEFQKMIPCQSAKIIINGLRVRQFLKRTLLARRDRLLV